MTRFNEGDYVRVVFDIKNDGTLFRNKRGEVMQIAGDTGYITAKQYHGDDIVYAVHFIRNNRVIGCRDKELISGDMEWSPPRYQKGDWVMASQDLNYQGKCLSSRGTMGKINALRYRPDMGYIYEMSFENSEKMCCLVEENQIEHTLESA